MNITFTTELYWLMMTIILTTSMWIPYIINRMSELGVMAAIWDPHGHTAAKSAWANRMMSAHYNAVENLVTFAPLVVIIQMTGLNSQSTGLACMVFFFARVVHFMGFTFAVPIVRVVSFLAGFFAQVVLIMSILSIL